MKHETKETKKEAMRKTSFDVQRPRGIGQPSCSNIAYAVASTVDGPLVSCSSTVSSGFFFTSPGLLNTTDRFMLPPILPVSGACKVTFGVFVPNPRWNVFGSTRPGGCWNAQFARVQAAPNLHGVEKCDVEGWRYGHPAFCLMQLAPYRQGICSWCC